MESTTRKELEAILQALKDLSDDIPGDLNRFRLSTLHEKIGALERRIWDILPVQTGSERKLAWALSLSALVKPKGSLYKILEGVEYLVLLTEDRFELEQDQIRLAKILAENHTRIKYYLSDSAKRIEAIIKNQFE